MTQKQSEKVKLSEMTWKQRLSYFNDYYRTVTIIGVIALIIIVALIYGFLRPKNKPILTVALVNDTIDLENKQAFLSAANTYFDVSEKKGVSLDSSFAFAEDAQNPTVANEEQKFQAFVSAGQIDAVIMDEALFIDYANMGFFTNLANQLPSDLYSKVSNSLYLNDSINPPANVNDPTSDNDLKAYGISLKGTKYESMLKGELENPILAITITSEKKSNVSELVRFMFQ